MSFKRLFLRLKSSPNGSKRRAAAAVEPRRPLRGRRGGRAPLRQVGGQRKIRRPLLHLRPEHQQASRRPISHLKHASGGSKPAVFPHFLHHSAFSSLETPGIRVGSGPAWAFTTGDGSYIADFIADLHHFRSFSTRFYIVLHLFRLDFD